MIDKNKHLALSLVSFKIANTASITYTQISQRTGYSHRQLIRFKNKLLKVDKETLLRHGNTGKRPALSATSDEILFLIDFKKAYPICTIAQFRDIYMREVIHNPKRLPDVVKYQLRPRSYSFFQRFYQDYHYHSPASPSQDFPIFKQNFQESRGRGTCIYIASCPDHWLRSDRYTLHVMFDDTTNQILGGYFEHKEKETVCLQLMKQLLIQQGIPESLLLVTSQARLRIGFKNNLERICDRFGMDLLIIKRNCAQEKSGELFHTIKQYMVKQNISLPDASLDEMNQYLKTIFIPAFNQHYQPVRHYPSCFIPLPGNFDFDSLVMRTNRKVTMKGSVYYRSHHYYFIDEQNEIISLPPHESVIIEEDIFHNTLYAHYHDQRYELSCDHINA